MEITEGNIWEAYCAAVIIVSLLLIKLHYSYIAFSDPRQHPPPHHFPPIRLGANQHTI